SSRLRSKWSSIARLPRPVMRRTSSTPASTASSTTYWIAGLSTSGSISFGMLLVTGRNRVPSPAAGSTAFLTGCMIANVLREGAILFKTGGAHILVPGGTGFLGTHVCAELRTAGAAVIALGRADGDLRHRAVIDATLDQHRPDAVIHLAAVV